MKMLDCGRVYISAIVVGTARRLIDESLQYAISCEQFSQRIADFQKIQEKLADDYIVYTNVLPKYSSW